MTNLLTQLKIPADFLRRQFPMSAAELAFGWEKHWVAGIDIVDILAFWWGQGSRLTNVDEEVASLFPNELWRLPELLECAVADAGTPARAAGEAVWLYLLLAWLFENRTSFSDPWVEIEKVYADFGYPKEISGFVRFMPVPKGEPATEAAMTRRWAEFVWNAKARLLQERPQPARPRPPSG